LLLALVMLGLGTVVGAKESIEPGGSAGTTEVLLSDAAGKLGSFPRAKERSAKSTKSGSTRAPSGQFRFPPKFN